MVYPYRHERARRGAHAMTTRYLLAAGAWIVLTLVQAGSSARPAQAQPASALTGQVTSAEEGPMEGVLVSVKKIGSTITTTVVTDQQGRYRFPGPRLTPGPYAISVRAVGYELDRPNVADVGANGPVTADLRLRKARDLAAELTNAEWLASMPGTEEQRKARLGCVNCHTLERVLRTSYDAAGLLQVQQRMGTYVNQSTLLHIQLRRAERVMEMRGDERQRARQALAEFLSGVNLNGRPSWPYELRTLPRPTGRSTRVVITEYDLPRPTIQPHDVIVDPDGVAWYCNFGEQTLGKLDPRTGRVTEYRVPELKPGVPTGALSVRFDRDSNLWLGMMFQGGVGKFETWEPFRESAARGRNHNIYDVIADSKNNAYFTDFLNEHIGRIDAKTGVLTLYTIPTPRSAPRRGQMDAQDRLWFGEYRGNKIGMFDTRAERFAEWTAPRPWSQPYDVTLDKNGEAWTGSMLDDGVLRLDPKTGVFTEYLLPRSTNIRRVFVDSSTTPVTFWVGSNHGASVIKLEPLD